MDTTIDVTAIEHGKHTLQQVVELLDNKLTEAAGSSGVGLNAEVATPHYDSREAQLVLEIRREILKFIDRTNHDLDQYFKTMCEKIGGSKTTQ